MTTRLTVMMCLCTLVLVEQCEGQAAPDGPHDVKPASRENGTLRTIDWAGEFSQRELPTGVSLADDPEKGKVLVVTAADQQPITIPLATIHQPGISEQAYRLEGMVRYEAVSEPGYLEMWNYFGDHGFFFTRTLGDTGPMGRLEGSSSWRTAILPFFINDKDIPGPERLEVNLVLPAGGKVQLTNLTLIEGELVATPWLNAGTIVGLLGALFGICGGLYGWSCSSGRWWTVMRHFPVFCYVCGVISLLVATVGYANGWSWTSTYSATLLGALLIVVVAGNQWYNRRVLHRSGPSAEVRRMQSLDA